MNHFFINDTGELMYIKEMPVGPVIIEVVGRPRGKSAFKIKEEYQQALQSAKQGAVKVKNKIKTLIAIEHSINKRLEPGQIYSLEGYKVEIEDVECLKCEGARGIEAGENWYPCTRCNQKGWTEQLAIVSPVSVETEKEETETVLEQEELWKDLEIKVKKNQWFAGDLYNYLKRNYFITPRKP